MITYEYLREDGRVFEVVQSIKDEPLTACPETGLECHRIITTKPTIAWKDPWFHTEYTSG